MQDEARITPYVDNEYDPLGHVIMCLANPFDIDMTDPPDEFTDEVAIRQMEANPHRPYNVETVHEQQNQLIAVLRENGTEVHLADSIGSSISQHFSRDVSFTIGGLFFVARPRRMYRRAEIAGLKDILSQIDTVHHIESGTIEGGDVIVDNDTVIIGLGEETSHEGIDEVATALKTRGIDKSIRRIEFTHGGTIHTDTLFNVVAPGVALIHRPSFNSVDFKWLSDRFDLIEATTDECIAVKLNTLSIGGGKVVMAEGTERLAEKMAKRGLEPIIIAYDEVNALPGSFRCTTCPIVRHPA